MMRPRPAAILNAKKKAAKAAKRKGSLKELHQECNSAANIFRNGHLQADTVNSLLPHEVPSDTSAFGVALQEKPSIDQNLPHLADEEREFVELVKSGDVEKVRYFLDGNPMLEVNCQNYEGYTPLTYAVKAEDIPMVLCLLEEENLVVGDSILHAVATSNRSLVQLILDSRPDSDLGKSIGYSADYSPDITPLILAAQLEHYDIIRLLLKRGYVIEKIHAPDCFCKEKCENKMSGEGLDQSIARINMYKALSSPAYICQTSSDPILTSFLLSKELREISEIEREFKDVYLDIAAGCSRLAMDFLDQCRNSEEVDMILNRKEGNNRCEMHPNWRFTRVDLAIELDEKIFVSHNHTQQVLRTAWLEGWQNWKQLSFFHKLARLVPKIFFLPLMAIIYLIIPNSSFVETWRAPLNKFLAFASSYITFLILILIQNHLDSFKTGRGPPDTGVELVIALYVVGLTWRIVKLIWLYGFAWYIRQKWNMYDVTTVLLFDAALGCWIWSFLDVKWHGNINMPRNEWDQYDPTIIAELFYSIGITLAFGKLLYFFQIGQSLGPLLTSLSRMFMDIIHFMALFIVVMFSFSIGMFQIYHHYTGNVKVVDGGEIRQVDAFDSISRGFITLYWAIYGYTPPNYADVIVPDKVVVVDDKKVFVPHQHRLTELVGHTIYIVYYVAGVIILINLLIAMMSTSYSNVEENRDVEWKYSRTKVWMVFFQPGMTLPPPFNIVPSPKSLLYQLQWFIQRVRGKKSNHCSLGRCCYDTKYDSQYDDDDVSYELVMTNLTQRYLTSRRKGGGTGSGGVSGSISGGILAGGSRTAAATAAAASQVESKEALVEKEVVEDLLDELRHSAGDLRHTTGELRHSTGELRHSTGELHHLIQQQHAATESLCAGNSFEQQDNAVTSVDEMQHLMQQAPISEQPHGYDAMDTPPVRLRPSVGDDIHMATVTSQQMAAHRQQVARNQRTPLTSQHSVGSGQLPDMQSFVHDTRNNDVTQHGRRNDETDQWSQ